MDTKWTFNKLFKNLTPQQVAVYTGVFLSIIFLFIILSTWLLNGYLNGFVLVPVVLFFFLVTYITIRYVLRKYIYRKIKLIYKIIHRSKTSLHHDEEAMNLKEDILDNVQHDVQEWAQSQEKEIEYLKSLEKYRRNFLGNISHELKTPIFNIQGYLHTLHDGGLYDHNINVKYLERAINNVERLNTIVEDLDMIGKLESDEMVLELQSFDLYALVKEVFRDVEMQAYEKKIALQIKEGADNRYQVIADREAVRQVLTNLIVNSIKYGKEDGLTKIGFYDMDRYILVEVSDNGIGIEEKHHKHLFDRFYRVDKSRSREQGGSGLGLSIVKHIIEAHKQTISVRSTLNAGSTFGFTLEKAS